MAIEENRTNSRSLDEAVEHLEEAEVHLEHAREDEAKAEREVKEAIHEIEEASQRDEVDVHVIHVNELEKATFKEKIHATLQQVWDKSYKELKLERKPKDVFQTAGAQSKSLMGTYSSRLSRHGTERSSKTSTSGSHLRPAVPDGTDCSADACSRHRAGDRLTR